MNAARPIPAFSTEKQGRSGLGLEAQDALIHGFVERPHSTIVGDFVEVETGKNSNRTGLRKAIAEAKRLKASLIIPKLDRLSRKVSFISALMESGHRFLCGRSSGR